MGKPPKFYTINTMEGVPEMILGSADFVSRPIIVMAKEEIIDYIDEKHPPRLVMNFKNVNRISSEFINALLRIHDQVNASDGQLKFSHVNENVYAAFHLTKLTERVFKIYETTPQAIDDF